MPTHPKKWLVIERREENGQRGLHGLEVDINLTRETVGEWLKYFRRVVFVPVDPPQQRERGLNQPKIEGQPKAILGPKATTFDLLGYAGDDRAIRMHEVTGWEEASDELAGLCDKAIELDKRTFKSLCSSIITPIHAVRDLGAPGENGVPTLRRMP